VQLRGNASAATDAGPAAPLPSTPAIDSDSLSPLQWDMRQINAPAAHAITGGGRSVLVGDIDTGVDFNHPDLKANLDVADSVNCVSGAPVAGLAAQDDNGHGTHTAGTIAAAANGMGIVGVAPNVRLAAIKAGNADGFFFPESVVLLFAEQKGIADVSATGNESEDLAHPVADAESPDDTTPVLRDVNNACVVIPVEIPGVIGVSGTGNALQNRADGRLLRRAGHVDGVAPCRRRRRAHRERPPEPRAERREGVSRHDGRPAAVSRLPAAGLHGLRGRLRQRALLPMPGRHRQPLVVRQRAGGRAQRRQPLNDRRLAPALKQAPVSC
jgi:hypothetical protein